MTETITARAVADAIDRFSLMPFFPHDDGAKKALARLLARICGNDQQLTWLVDRVIQLFRKGWPGEAEVRAVFCSKFRPADGIEVASAIYEDGIPSENPNRDAELLAGGSVPKALTGEVAQVSSDSQMQETVEQLAEKLRLRRERDKASPMIAHGGDNDTAHYQSSCAACNEPIDIRAPKTVRRFQACACGAVYEHWQGVHGVWRAAISYANVQAV